MNTQDIKQNKHYFILIIVYGVILGVIYSYWMFKEDLDLWACILVGVLFVLCGVGCAFLSTLYVAKKNKKKAEEISVEEKSKEEDAASEVKETNAEESTSNEDNVNQ